VHDAKNSVLQGRHLFAIEQLQSPGFLIIGGIRKKLRSAVRHQEIARAILICQKRRIFSRSKVEEKDMACELFLIETPPLSALRYAFDIIPSSAAACPHCCERVSCACDRSNDIIITECALCPD
jgi:hypothetical protein